MLVAASAAVGAGCSRPSVERLEWVAMGTVAAVESRGVEVAAVMAARDDVRSCYDELTRLLNAHDANSELRRLSPFDDAEVLARCDDAVRECYAAAFRLQALSGSAFNPRWRGERTLDLGAIAKGYAVDLAAAKLPAAAGDWLLDLGGNLKSVSGVWRVGVAGGDGRGVVATVGLAPGEALATSATYYRGSHIVDGRTHRPADGTVAAVTVLADSAMWADGLSTTLFVLGPEEGRRLLDANADLRARVIAVKWLLADGGVVDFDPNRRFE